MRRGEQQELYGAVYMTETGVNLMYIVLDFWVSYYFFSFLHFFSFPLEGPYFLGLFFYLGGSFSLGSILAFCLRIMRALYSADTWFTIKPPRTGYPEALLSSTLFT